MSTRAIPCATPVRTSIAVTAYLVLAMIVAQFALAGAALFIAGNWWGAHAALGGSVVLPLALLLVQTRRGRPAACLRPASIGLAALYLLQVVLAALSDAPGWSALRAVHVANAALLLSAAVHLAVRARGLVNGVPPGCSRPAQPGG